MLALYRSGRQADALEAYRDARSALVQELGVEPSAELRELHTAILAQNPSLRPAVTGRAAGIDGDSAFVGYERELGILEGALERTFASRGSVVVIAGEPGIGKSRVAGQIAGLARSRGARVLWGRCWEAGGAPAYWPWVQALRSFVADCADDELRELAGLGAAELAQILPELRDRLPDDGGDELAGSDDARFRLFEAIAGLVRRAGGAEPLVFILDDLHAADEPSVLLLRYLADAVAESRVLIVTAYRDTELSEEHLLRATISELDRRGGCAQIALKGFGPSETARLVEHSMRERALPLLASAIHRASDGNPLFVTELVRLLEAEGKLTELTDAESLQLPAGFDEVIERWLQRLSARCRRTLATAAVIGRAFDLETLARACEASDAELVEELEEAITAHLVADAPGARGRLRFSHDLVREALYRKLSSVRRRRLHVAVGEALEQIYASNVEPHLAELAHHFFLAASRERARKAIDYACRAAQRGAGVLAYEEAVRLYGLALETIEWSEAARETERAELLIELADQLALAGDVRRARPALADAAREAQRLGDAHLGARAALLRSEIETMAGSDTAAQAIEWADAALAFFQQSGDDLHQSRAWGVKSLRNHGIGREVAAAQDAEQMLACARRAGSQALEAKAMDRLAYSLAHGPTPVEEGIPRLARMLEETGSAYTRARILMYLAELEATRGRYPEARQLYEQSNELMAKIGDVRELACGIAFSCSWVELLAGDFIASERHARSGCETFQRLEANGYLSSALNCIIEALIPQGKLDDARQIMSTASSLLNDPHDIDAIERQARARALIELTAGDLAAAERSARLAVETALQADYVCEQASNWLVLADSLCAAGREPEARDAAAEALATAEHKGHALFTARARSILTSAPTRQPTACASLRRGPAP